MAARAEGAGNLLNNVDKDFLPRLALCSAGVQDGLDNPGGALAHSREQSVTFALLSNP